MYQANKKRAVSKQNAVTAAPTKAWLAGTKRLGTKRYKPHSSAVINETAVITLSHSEPPTNCTWPITTDSPTPKDKGPNVSNAQYTKNCIIQGRCELTRQIRLNALSIVRISISEVTTNITLPMAVSLVALSRNALM